MFNVSFLFFPLNILMQIFQSGNHEFVFGKVLLFGEVLQREERSRLSSWSGTILINDQRSITRSAAASTGRLVVGGLGTVIGRRPWLIDVGTNKPGPIRGSAPERQALHPCSLLPFRRITRSNFQRDR